MFLFFQGLSYILLGKSGMEDIMDSSIEGWENIDQDDDLEEDDDEDEDDDDDDEENDDTSDKQ